MALGTNVGHHISSSCPACRDCGPSILRAGRRPGGDGATNKPLGGLRFNLGGEHPFYTVTHDRLPVVKSPYAWYMRVPDMPAFLRHITPVLEERLRNSPAIGHTGELKLSFYRNGVRLAFDAGRITSVEPWMPTHEDGGSAAFPGLTFLQLLFGYRTLDELRAAFVDCWTEGDDERSLVLALFPSSHRASCRSHRGARLGTSNKTLWELLWDYDPNGLLVVDT